MWVCKFTLFHSGLLLTLRVPARELRRVKRQELQDPAPRISQERLLPVRSTYARKYRVKSYLPTYKVISSNYEKR